MNEYETDLIFYKIVSSSINNFLFSSSTRNRENSVFEMFTNAEEIRWQNFPGIQEILTRKTRGT